ncbi:SAV_915 family protein [Nocardia sp. NPDC003979]
MRAKIEAAIDSVTDSLALLDSLRAPESLEVGRGYTADRENAILDALSLAQHHLDRASNAIGTHWDEYRVRGEAVSTSETGVRSAHASLGGAPVAETERSAKPRAMALPKEFPPVVYLPVLSVVHRVEDAQILLRKTRDGRIACLAYSALDRLYECCGSAQPWMWVPTIALDGLQQEQPFELLILDLHIPEENRGAA